MTFLNPALFWAFTAISIPILIHIFNLRRTKKMDFSTLMFLKEIQQTKYKKIRLKQLLILLCRIFFIGLLVMAFTRPYDEGYLSAGDSRVRSSVILLLDDSFSMEALQTSGNDFESAKKRLIEFSNSLNSEDEIFFITISDLDRSPSDCLIKDKTFLLDSLTNKKTKSVSRNMNETLALLERFISYASLPNKEVYFFSDGQSSQFSEAKVLSEKKNYKFYYIQCDDRQPNNISLDTLDVKSRIFSKERPVKMICRVNNRNKFDVKNKKITLFINGSSVKQEKAIDIPANSSLDIEFNVKHGLEGFISGYLEIENDNITEDEMTTDNRRHFTINIPKKISVLFVSSSEEDEKYLRLAMLSSEEMMNDSASVPKDFYDIKRIEQTKFSDASLDNMDVLVFINKNNFAQNEIIKLKEFLDKKHGAIFFTGNKIDAKSYNSSVFNELNLPFASSNIQQGEVQKFNKADLVHPIFENIFKSNDKIRLIDDSPSINSYTDFSSESGAPKLISLTNGKPFLVESSNLSGRVLLFSIAPDMLSSDFPSKYLFVPLMIQSIQYAASIDPIKEAIVGKDYFVSLDKNNLSDLSMSIQNSGLTFKLGDINSEIINVKSFTKTNGEYLLKSNEKILFEFPVNHTKHESETHRLTPSEIKENLKNNFAENIFVINKNENLLQAVKEEKSGKEIWHYFFILALIFLLTEFLLSRSLISKQKVQPN